MKDPIQITELFMAQADKHRRFYGTITRGQDSTGQPVVYGKIKVNEGYVCAQAADDVELGRKLDEMVRMVLDNAK